MSAAAPPQSTEILTFETAGRRYGLPSAAVREVIRAVAPAPALVPNEAVAGLINLRGEVLPLLNLRCLAGLPPADISPHEHFIVVSAGPRGAALRADRAIELLCVAATECGPPPDQSRDHLLAFAARLPDGLVLVLDPARLLAAAEAHGDQQEDA